MLIWVMARLLALFPLLLVAASVSGQTKNKVDWPECYCTDKAGQRVELGELRCLSVDGRDFMARCEMSLNNPMWRELGEGCVSSQAPRQGDRPAAG